MEYDFVIMGSGFGGSITAMRLAESGYKVLLAEQGRRFTPADFPKRNWNLVKWLWVPGLRFYGFFRIRLFRHITVLAGAGVGGGSLVYANTLPVPESVFFTSGSWKDLADWEQELQPHYGTARQMLGTKTNPKFGPGDEALERLSQIIGKRDCFHPTEVAVFFGEPEQKVVDPYFNGEGPDREGCRFCGGCMVGCRYNAKNTLDKNYLFLAEKAGARVMDRTRVVDVRPIGKSGSGGYRIAVKKTGGFKRQEIETKAFIFSGGVLGTVPLLLRLKKSSLPDLSDLVGAGIRTNNEALIGVVSKDKTKKFSEGIAIGSIVHTDEFSHLEPVRYPSGSGFWRLLMAPMISGRTLPGRIGRILKDFLVHPVANFRVYFTGNWADRTQILLFMQTRDSTLRLSRGFFGLRTRVENGTAPSAFIPEAQMLATDYARIIDGKPLVLPTESLFGIPTTAHILGGACMGKDSGSGVIDKNHKVFGYENLFIIDGSAISANPGVNPSLTISALAERAAQKLLEQYAETKGMD
ncbi:MAG: GMC oxidoreductase [Bacteroidetes bacterium GWF2_49_14]|nr:MAG: GMC oxidoreductase [Bacteroidetes bacterium GWF2_49_14]HBB90447.1 GMC family oxidoreductase [Bacteroidales bacterium]